MSSDAIINPLPAEARAIGRRLKEVLGAESVYLFGSHARGEAGPDSDLDLVAIVPHSQKTQYARAVDALRAVRGIHFPKDIIVLTRAEWEADVTVVCSLASTVLREGFRLDDG